MLRHLYISTIRIWRFCVWNLFSPIKSSSSSFDHVCVLYIALKNLDPNKAHGHNMISVRILKTCCESILKPFELILKSCIESGKFPIEWKKAKKK